MPRGAGMNDPLSHSWIEESASSQPLESPPLSAPPSTISCWRCGKEVLVELARCPYCAAPHGQDPPAAAVEQWLPDRNARSLTWLLGFFGVMLGISILAGTIHYLTSEVSPRLRPNSWESLLPLLFFEAIDTVLVFAAWCWVGVCRPEPRRSWLRRLAAWAIAIPGLAMVLALNFFYHHALRHWIGAAGIERAPLDGYAALATSIFAICLQPAIVEELFFRHLMFGALRSLVRGHTVVWVTSVMFAAAHVGAPLSMPVLLVLGALLGYARLATGRLHLPIVLHFVHNGVVLWATMR